jgi:hypothetical protein
MMAERTKTIRWLLAFVLLVCAVAAAYFLFAHVRTRVGASARRAYRRERARGHVVAAASYVLR